MEKLPPFDRETLSEEIRGLQPARPALRLKQMLDLGVFDEVEGAVRVELSAARAALAEWPGHSPARHLLALSDVLLAQVASLRPAI
jgi:hypothetical protein